MRQIGQYEGIILISAQLTIIISYPVIIVYKNFVIFPTPPDSTKQPERAGEVGVWRPGPPKLSPRAYQSYDSAVVRFSHGLPQALFVVYL